MKPHSMSIDLSKPFSTPRSLRFLFPCCCHPCSVSHSINYRISHCLLRPVAHFHTSFALLLHCRINVNRYEPVTAVFLSFCLLLIYADSLSSTSCVRVTVCLQPRVFLQLERYCQSDCTLFEAVSRRSVVMYIAPCPGSIIIFIAFSLLQLKRGLEGLFVFIYISSCKAWSHIPYA